MGTIPAGRGRRAIARRLTDPRNRFQSRLGLGAVVHARSPVEQANLASVRERMREMCRLPVVEGAAIMPDACPAGPGITVGGAIVTENAIIPAAHSADICCSMFATFFRAGQLNISTAMDTLLGATRFGPGGRRKGNYVPHPVLDEPHVWRNPFLRGLEDYAARHMCDQGDGNHFSYLGKVSLTPAASQSLIQRGHQLEADAYYVLVTHHGSRGLGAQLYKRGVKAAERHTSSIAKGIPKWGHWLDYTTNEGHAYWEALQYVARWTRANHQCVHAAFTEPLVRHGSIQSPDAHLGNEHNFVWKRSQGGRSLFYHGKGATPAWKDDNGLPLLGLIPLNMAAPILLVEGGDQAKYLSFAPHGAGRNESRSALLRRFQKRDGSEDTAAMAKALAQSTQGVDVRWYSGTPDLSETPLGYKDANILSAQIEHFGLARVLAHIQPLGCVMAGHITPAWKR